MNLTKKIFLTLVFAGLTILTIQAQPARGEGGRRGGDPTERANRQSERMIAPRGCVESIKTCAKTLAFGNL